MIENNCTRWSEASRGDIMRKVSVFRGSPRKKGNTNAITGVFVHRLRSAGVQVIDVDIHEKKYRGMCGV